MPVAGNSRDLFALASSAIVVVPVSRPAGIDPAVLEGLFDLTPGEARVARALASGLEVDGVAGAFGVASSTVRSQLKSIFAKTGTGRQADLMAIPSAASAVSRRD